MWVTLYTDAAYSHDDGSAGWGIWARSELGRIVKHGKAPTWIDDVNAAEIYAIVTGVGLIVEAWPDVVGVQVNTDSSTALRAVAGKPTNGKTIERCARMLEDLIEKYKIVLRGKHVRAHGRGKDVRTWLNNAVDRLAAKGRTG